MLQRPHPRAAAVSTALPVGTRVARRCEPKAGNEPSKETPVEHASRNRDQIEARLRHRYVEIWTDVRRELQKHDGQQYEDLVQGAGDAVDDATADLLVDLNLAEIDRDIEEMRAVHAAIARLERGDYGICQSCGSEISAARLEALPQAAFCIDCQTRREKSTRSTPSL
jgi:RNA polymerase-binding protein DksA